MSILSPEPVRAAHRAGNVFIRRLRDNELDSVQSLRDSMSLPAAIRKDAAFTTREKKETRSAQPAPSN